MGILCCIWWLRKRKRSSPTARKQIESPRWKVDESHGIYDRMDKYLLQYTRLLEVAKDTLEISEEILGLGKFGVVFKGLAHSLPRQITSCPTHVAVKTIRNNNSNPMSDMDSHHKQFVDEMNIMALLGRHANVVNLLGVVITNHNFLLLLEYCRFGSLDIYLKSADRKKLIYVHVGAIGNFLPFEEENMKKHWLATLQKGEERIDSTNKLDIISTNDLLMFAYQISRGMEYLVSRSIIHRDLAGRNVLVADNKVVKISDFGLAKHGHTAYTITNMMVELSVRWMSPEAIISGLCSHHSDVWSFGVLLWEIFSLGHTPFEDLYMKDFSACSFADLLMGGYQMKRPPGAPVIIYEIMRQCWDLTAENRPTFAEIKRQLDSFLSGDDKSKVYLRLQEEPDNEEFTKEYNEIQKAFPEPIDYDIVMSCSNCCWH